ncbi:MAG: SDR family oxidoreductase [Putridiphycobacter sp.]
MRILVTGSNGLLGQKIIKQLNDQQINYLATSLGENRFSECHNYQSLDITNAKRVNAVFEDFQPTHVINTAAITNVDYCEDNIDLCQKVNVDSVKILFEASQKINAHFIHLSTDFVFDGQAGPYVETDTPNPLSVYAKSKHSSEQILIHSDDNNWAILRTIIVYGEGENLSRGNLVVWAKSALKAGQKLTIVNDQFRAPTWADDLAWACIQTAKLNANGVFHISGPETKSIYDWVLTIADYFKLPTHLIEPIESSTLNQKAPRPPKTGFVITKAQKQLGYKPKSFIETLQFLS